MNPRDADFERIEADAAAWLARRDGGLSRDDEAAFQRWRESDPRHETAIAEIEAAWSVLDRPRANGSAPLVRSEMRSRARRRTVRRIGIAAAVGAGCLALVLSLRRPGTPRNPSDLSAPSATARILMPERQVLADGSVVELSPGSRIDPNFTPDLRRVLLVRGEARFEVAKDPAHPFVVSAGTVDVRAVGTAFAVSLTPGEVQVLVTEGQVAVARGLSSKADPARNSFEQALVSAGGSIAVPTENLAPAMPAVVAVTPEEIDRRLAWTVPRLEFADTTISEAAALFNRRNRVRLEVGDPAVARLKVNGVFRADNVDGFVRLLESSFDVRAERRPDGAIRLRSAR